MGRVKRIWYLSPIRTVSPEPPRFAHTSSEPRGTFRQKARSLAPLNGWACAVKICHDGMLEDTNSLDAPHVTIAIHGENLTMPFLILPGIRDSLTSAGFRDSLIFLLPVSQSVTLHGRRSPTVNRSDRVVID